MPSPRVIPSTNKFLKVNSDNPKSTQNDEQGLSLEPSERESREYVKPVTQDQDQDQDKVRVLSRSLPNDNAVFISDDDISDDVVVSYSVIHDLVMTMVLYFMTMLYLISTFFSLSSRESFADRRVTAHNDILRSKLSHVFQGLCFANPGAISSVREAVQYLADVYCDLQTLNGLDYYQSSEEMHQRSAAIREQAFRETAHLNLTGMDHAIAILDSVVTCRDSSFVVDSPRERQRLAKMRLKLDHGFSTDDPRNTDSVNACCLYDDHRARADFWKLRVQLDVEKDSHTTMSRSRIMETLKTREQHWVNETNAFFENSSMSEKRSARLYETDFRDRSANGSFRDTADSAPTFSAPTFSAPDFTFKGHSDTKAFQDDLMSTKSAPTFRGNSDMRPAIVGASASRPMLAIMPSQGVPAIPLPAAATRPPVVDTALDDDACTHVSDDTESTVSDSHVGDDIESTVSDLDDSNDDFRMQLAELESRFNEESKKLELLASRASSMTAQGASAPVRQVEESYSTDTSAGKERSQHHRNERYLQTNGNSERQGVIREMKCTETDGQRASRFYGAKEEQYAQRSNGHVAQGVVHQKSVHDSFDGGERCSSALKHQYTSKSANSMQACHYSEHNSFQRSGNTMSTHEAKARYEMHDDSSGNTVSREVRQSTSSVGLGLPVASPLSSLFSVSVSSRNTEQFNGYTAQRSVNNELSVNVNVNFGDRSSVLVLPSTRFSSANSSCGLESIMRDFHLLRF